MFDLNPRQARFVEEYLVDLSAVEAAKRAGYSQKSAYSSGPRLLAHAGIRAAIAAGMEARAERKAIDADWVVERLRLIADDDDTPPAARVSALSQLGKHTGGFVERTESNAATSIEVNIRTFDELPAPIHGELIEHTHSGASGADNAELGNNEELKSRAPFVFVITAGLHKGSMSKPVSRLVGELTTRGLLIDTGNVSSRMAGELLQLADCLLTI